MSEILRFDQLGRGDIDVAGGKGANLGELTQAGFPVPDGFVISTAAYRAFVAANDLTDSILDLAESAASNEPGTVAPAADKIRALIVDATIPEEMCAEILDAYHGLADTEAAVAVRSSATAEDLAEASFAGQQDTFLNVRGSEALLSAVRDCWASLWTARAMAYRSRQEIDPQTLSLAVVVQQLVEADAAGVMFTANPGNGRRDQVAIGAAWGLGESVVSGTVNTDDIIVSPDQGTVVSRTTADKSVETVPTSTGTRERPVPPARRHQPVLDDAAAIELAGWGTRIAEHFGAPQDIEWARAGEQFFILQARPITMLPEPTGAVPTDWPLPDPKGFYFRASIVEQLPDPLSPLFADLVDKSVSRSLLALMREFMGKDLLHDDDIGLPTINGYAYYRYARGALYRVSLRTPMAIKMLLTTGSALGVSRWQQRSRPRYVEQVRRWTDREVEELQTAELLTGVVELLDAGTEYYTAVQTVIPIAASSEVIFAGFYDRLIRRPGDPGAQIFLLGFDSVPIRAEKSLYDVARWAREHPPLADAVQALPADRLVALLRSGEPPEGVDPALWQDWGSRFQAHLDQYGHAVYNLDFVNAVPADDPGPLLETLRFYLGENSGDPYERQRQSVERRERAVAAVLARVDPIRGATFSRLLRWAQAVAPIREDALADVGLAWPQLRRMMVELGRRLVRNGAINQPEQVFWLREDEVRQLVSADGGVDQQATLVERIEQRKMVWRGQRLATPPQLLPEGTWIKYLESWMPAASANQTGDVIKGTGASAGQVTATARVLEGPHDFARMQPGDILVTSITTPAWTTLFALAAGVVTDVGGPLSHSSIVAREYGIPAVLGTGVATRRIRDGQRIRVDGDAGTITLLEDGDDNATDDSAGHARPAQLTDSPATDRLRRIGLVTGTTALVGWLLVRRHRRRQRSDRGRQTD